MNYWRSSTLTVQTWVRSVLVCWNKVVEAMHLMLAAEHVLCQSSLNSSLRHCSSTGFLSNQLADCTLGLNHSPQRAKGPGQAGLQTSRLGLEAKRLLCVISWEQQSPGHAHQAVLLGTQQATDWHSKHKDRDESKALNWKLHGPPAARYSTSVNTLLTKRGRVSLLCRSLVTKQPRLLMPLEAPPSDDKLHKAWDKQGYITDALTSAGGNFKSKPLLNDCHYLRLIMVLFN